MNKKYDFKKFTGYNATKYKAIELCGKEFIDGLIAQKIFAKDDQFWILVCEKLEIPDMKEKEERERKLAEERREQEKKRLLNQKTIHCIRERKGWEISIFEMPESDIFSDKYCAVALKDGDFINHTSNPYYWGESWNVSYDRLCSLIDVKERSKASQIERDTQTKLMQQLYLIILYISGWDIHHTFNDEEPNKQNFYSIQSWISMDFGTLDLLEEKGLVDQPQTKGKHYRKRTYVEVTKEGIRKARQLLRELDFDGMQELLQKTAYHEEYIEDTSDF
ncbi:DUF6429 family protein [[Limnothrix rosea] IAM M-220]|uniref:DUF6429 family protein n=1 Tax=[Limnothrix rosea] IAM M-220 TaxID=454133 RepID=UPI000966B37E|nr:DUF6429 family protein [[Limnothrix rosea] IAM M-220]OKH17123.1 hypothetical protein NIES208_10580 [[Limnothrix rosea] IAM M-220]